MCSAQVQSYSRPSAYGGQMIASSGTVAGAAASGDQLLARELCSLIIGIRTTIPQLQGGPRETA